MKRSRVFLAGILVFGMGIWAGCGRQEHTAVELPVEAVQEETAEGVGTLILKVNPEIAVEYDENGKVTAVRGLNEDGKRIVADYQGYEGKECQTVVKELVAAIHDAGYFVEEIEGENRKITIEIETGSVIPEEGFLDKVAEGVQDYVAGMQSGNPAVTEGAEDYEIYDHEYGEHAYEVPVPSGQQKPESENGQQASPDGTGTQTPAVPDENAGTQTSPVPDSGIESQVPSASDRPDAGNRTDGSYTDYASPYTDYHEPNTPYGVSDYATPYDVSNYGNSGYSHYDSHSNYDDHSDYHSH